MEQDNVLRDLASSYENNVAVKIDYNILSVAAMTLALILLVEVIRHRLDHAARERPFFNAVLEGFYRELTTLGIVEFCLFLMAEYYPEYNKGRKAAFGDVHFCLFETAILNAASTCATAAMALHVSRRIWVRTERLEVTHYVEIRRAFEQAQQEHNNNKHTKKQSSSSQYANLLLQIRFHELRVQFLQAYRLPLQLQISDYLLRSEKDILTGLIHISTTSWLFLTGAVCLLYYGIGMVFYHVPDQELAGRILTCVFFASIGLFVMISYAVSIKMKSIFQTILQTEWNATTEEQERLRKAQLALFWGHQPKNVIHLIQFMQFGFALAVSTLILFWKEISEGSIPAWVYLVSIVVCYTVFVIVTGHAIPQYTLCTSLGQLVDEKRLRETVALFRLQEAKQRELERSADITTTATTRTTTTSSSRHHTPIHRVDTGVAELVTVDTAELRAQVRKQRRQRRKTQSEGVATMAASFSTDTADASSVAGNSVATASSVATTASGSRQSRGRPRQPRGNRKKSLSDGVSAMFAMGDRPKKKTLYDNNDDDALSDDSGYISAHDDIPAMMITRDAETTPPPLPRIEQLRSFFWSERYVFVSNVFGTIVALILVGERVEGFIQGRGLISKEFVTLALPRVLSFWFLAVWLMSCLVTSWFIMYLHGTNIQKKNPKALIAASIDACIFSICVVVFLVAEAYRCCVTDNNDDEEACTCSQYGSRLYGGLGKIEPFTSLVCLRVFRHWIAGRFVEWQQERNKNDEDEEPRTEHDYFHHHGEPSTSVVEAWEQAVRENPEVIAKHGEFSEHVLRIMLGAGLPEGLLVSPHKEAVSSATDFPRPGLDVVNESSRRLLSEQGQEVVVSNDFKNSLAEGEHKESLSNPNLLARIPSPRRPAFFRQSSMFEMVVPAHEAPSLEGYENMVTYPNARLVRTMRRCDRMFLPLLEHWGPVDVVLTRFEMVYFDIQQEGGGDTQEQAAEHARRVVVATKGGKGLRLHEVATGRRVVGRMLMKDVASIHVEREKVGENEGEAVSATTEYWKDQGKTGNILELDEKEEEAKIGGGGLQDRLRIDSLHGQTLFLRFYSDIEDAKHHPEHQASELEGSLFKNNAFQWAQTISRLCGKEQLKQPLPHFGQDNADELRDFLVVADAAAVTKAHRRGFDLRRRRTPGSPRRSGSKGRLHRQSSLAEDRSYHKRSRHASLTNVSQSRLAVMRQSKSFSDAGVDLENGEGSPEQRTFL